MPAVIRVSAVYTMSDQVSSKLAKMAAKVTALESALGKANGRLDSLGDRAKSAVNPLGDVNKQLSDMKKTVGTAKGSSGLVYRVDQLNKRLKALGGGKNGHQIRVSTTGVKRSEADLLRLQGAAAALTAKDYKIKVEVDKNTIGLLKEQATALDRVAGSIKEVKLGFSALKKGEAELRSTMGAKTKAAKQQRQVLSEVSRQMRRSASDAMRFKRAAKDGGFEVKSLTQQLIELHRANAASGGAFARGLKMGFPFAKMLPMIAMGANVAGVAVGGLVVALHGLIGPVLSVVSSMKDMVGVVALLPAAYGSAAVAVGSFIGASKALFGSALTNAGKLNEIQRKLDTVKDAEERKTLMEQQSKLLGEMNPKQQALAKSVAGLMQQWRELFTSNEQLSNSFFGMAEHGVETASRLIKRYGADITATADSVRQLADHFFDVAQRNRDLDQGIRSLFRMSRNMVQSLGEALVPLLAFFGRVLTASERPMARVGDAFARWAHSLNRIDVASIERFITRGIDTTSQWWRILKNLGGAFGNIFRAGRTETQGLLDTLEQVTAQFKAWTGNEGFGIIQREFQAGMKVAKSLGRFVTQFVKQFMVMGADGEVGSSVIQFIDMMTNSLPSLFDFMSNALKQLGPSMTNFMRTFPSMLELFEAAIPGMTLALDILSELNKVFAYLIDNVPGLKQLLGVLLAFKAAAFIFGGAMGHMFGFLSGGVTTIGLLTKKFRIFRSVMKSGGIVKGLAAVAARGVAAGGAGAASGGVRGLIGGTLGAEAAAAGGGVGAAGAAGAGARHLVGPWGQAKFGYQATRAYNPGLGKGYAVGQGIRSGASGLVAGGVRATALRAIPVAGYGLVAYDALKIVSSDASGMEKTAAVGNLGAITAGGAMGASIGSALGPLGSLGGAVVGGVAGATVAPAAAWAGQKYYGGDKAQKALEDATRQEELGAQFHPMMRQLAQQEADINQQKVDYIKRLTQGQDLQKKMNRQGLVTAFEKLAKLDGGQSSMLSSHPSSPDRAQRVRARLQNGK